MTAGGVPSSAPNRREQALVGRQGAVAVAREDGDPAWRRAPPPGSGPARRRAARPRPGPRSAVGPRHAPSAEATEGVGERHQRLVQVEQGGQVRPAQHQHLGHAAPPGSRPGPSGRRSAGKLLVAPALDGGGQHPGVVALACRTAPRSPPDRGARATTDSRHRAQLCAVTPLCRPSASADERRYRRRRCSAGACRQAAGVQPQTSSLFGCVQASRDPKTNDQHFRWSER
jgi:hypothetical protein